eukprot:2687757-Prymnesium_polylepis.1
MLRPVIRHRKQIASAVIRDRWTYFDRSKECRERASLPSFVEVLVDKCSVTCPRHATARQNSHSYKTARGWRPCDSSCMDHAKFDHLTL